jgi:hypothetical protein
MKCVYILFTKEVFRCPNGFFNFGSKCLRFFEMNTSADTMTYEDGAKFCTLNNMDMLVSNGIYDLRYEVMRFQSRLAFANSSDQVQSREKMMCFYLRAGQDAARLLECRKPFTLICSRNRGN